MSSFTCPKCGRTSHNPNDVREGYCGACHDWTGKVHPADCAVCAIGVSPDDDGHLYRPRLPFPFVGERKPVLGDRVAIDFGSDTYLEHPEIDGGIVSFISTEHISVLYGHHEHKRFRIVDCKRIEVLSEHP